MQTMLRRVTAAATLRRSSNVFSNAMMITSSSTTALRFQSTLANGTPDAESFLDAKDKWSGVLSIQNPPKLTARHYELLRKLNLNVQPPSSSSDADLVESMKAHFAAEVARAYAPLALRPEDMPLERLPSETQSSYHARQVEACQREIALEYNSAEARARRYAALSKVQLIERQLAHLRALRSTASDDTAAQVAQVFQSAQRDNNQLRLLEDAWSRMPADLKAAFETQSRRTLELQELSRSSGAAASAASGLTTEQQRDLFETVEGDAVSSQFEVPQVNWELGSPTDLAKLSRGLATAWELSTEASSGASTSGNADNINSMSTAQLQEHLAELFPPSAMILSAADGSSAATTGSSSSSASSSSAASSLLGALNEGVDVGAVLHGVATNLQDVSKRLRGARRRNLRCRFCHVQPGQEQEMAMTYTNLDLLHQYINVRGMIYPRKLTGNCQRHQRRLRQAVKRARYIGLLSYTSNWRVPPSWFVEQQQVQKTSGGGVSVAAAAIDAEHEEAGEYVEEEDVEEGEDGEEEVKSTSNKL